MVRTLAVSTRRSLATSTERALVAWLSLAAVASLSCADPPLPAAATPAPLLDENDDPLPRTPRAECLDSIRLFCIYADGTALRGEHDPRVAPHDSLTIVVLGDRAALDGQLLRLEASSGSSPSQVVVTGGSNTRATSEDGGAEADADSDALGGAGPAQAEDPDDRLDKLLDLHINDIPDLPTLTVTYKRNKSSKIDSGLIVERPLNFGLGKNGYLLELALAFPIVFGGDRTISVVPQPNGAVGLVHQYDSTTNAIDHASLALNVYPWGYPSSRCPYSNSQLANYIPFVCHPKLLVRPIALQLGTSIAANSFQEWFLGIGYTVVRGVTVTTGMAWVPRQSLGPTLFEGQEVPASYQIPSSALDHGRVFRPYLGISLSPEILQAALEVLNKTKSIGRPASD